MANDNPLTGKVILNGLAGLSAMLLMWVFTTVIWESVSQIPQINETLAVHDEKIKRNTLDISQNKSDIRQLHLRKASQHSGNNNHLRYVGVFYLDDSIRHSNSSGSLFNRGGDSGYILHLYSSESISTGLSTDWRGTYASGNRQLPTLLLIPRPTNKRVGNFNDDRHSNNLHANSRYCM